MSVSRIEPHNPSNLFDGNFKLLQGINRCKRATAKRSLSQCTKLLSEFIRESGKTLMIAPPTTILLPSLTPFAVARQGSCLFHPKDSFFPIRILQEIGIYLGYNEDGVS